MYVIRLEMFINSFNDSLCAFWSEILGFYVRDVSTVDRDEKLFNRASKDMKEWITALSSVEVQMMFANIEKSSDTLKKKTENIDNLASM